jgi:signal transduction histidine kinase
MIKWIKNSSLAILALGVCSSLRAEHLPTSQSTDGIEIHSVTVDGKPISLTGNKKTDLGPFPKNISFAFGPGIYSGHIPIRIHYKLEGYDNNWHESAGSMYLAIRFYNNVGDVIGQTNFYVSGDSLGWHGHLQSSSLTHRRETLIVPPQASKLWIVISSAGPPATVGIYVVDGLIVSSLSSSNKPEILLRSPFDRPQKDDVTDQIPDGWLRDGTTVNMAKVVGIGQDLMTKAFAILDDNPLGHAEWHNTPESAPKVIPGEQMVIEWNEMFSMGVADVLVANYDSLPPGNYEFHVAYMTIMGVPNGEETSLAVIVPQPFWRKPLFWGVIFLVLMVIMTLVARYFIWYRMRREMARLKYQRALEQERLRIARDIHDDLGARVTQISMLSAMAHDNPKIQEEARVEFNEISRVSRDLISALYETVWAVSPENDNLEALGSYLCQMVNKLSDKAQFRCRFHIQRLPRDIQVSSQTRHNISLAVKEAVHNIIKHAKASEVIVRITFVAGLLTISIQDDGCGFQLAGNQEGNGLTNMKQRLENLGGSCSIESQPGCGTTVFIRLEIRPTV